MIEEYLTTEELSSRIKLTPGTIRNLVWKKDFRKNVHYVKPGGRKLLFKWSAVESWLHDGNNISSPCAGSLINI